ncbi:MAG: ATP-binding protein [Chloroflexi bacterium SZAS-1]|jgi:predicted ATPase with chaperone activity|nr:ATP-binding protein [Chloroflexi bacterium SZAS-1]HNP85513.1 ATP-binding protein [Kouleothrix sp.]
MQQPLTSVPLNEAQQAAPQLPPRPRSIDDTGLSMTFISDMIVRALYLIGEMTGQQIVDLLHLPYDNVIDQAISYLRREQMCEIKGTGGIGEKAYRYQASVRGVERAKEVGERTQYLGPAPVTLQAYTEMMQRQSTQGLVITEDSIRQAFAHLVIGEALLQQLGPAINSGKSIFLFGHAGNGKTSIAEAVSKLMSDTIMIPHAVIIDGQIIRVFDPIHHDRVPVPTQLEHTYDKRWVLSKRPIVIAGGELNLDSLDLVYDEYSKYYEAPLQMKANGGLFLIDDFGRQQVRPRELLNRWIVPLEKRQDFLTLHTGKKIDVPFDQLIIFSTNIEPKQLVDEAFLRRIRYKIEVGNPSAPEYREILRRICKAKNVPYSDEGLRYLLEQEYGKRNLELRACHPRDLIDQLIDIARFTRTQPTMSRELLSAACKSYFVEV